MKPTQPNHVPPLGHNIYQPTDTRYNFLQIFDFPCLKCEQAFRCNSWPACCDSPASACAWDTPLLTGSWWWRASSWVTRPTSCRRSETTTSQCSRRCAWPHTTVRPSAPSPWQLCHTLRRPGCRRKNLLLLWFIYIFVFVITVDPTLDADVEAAAFAKNARKEDDDLEDWDSIFWKRERCTSSHIPATAADMIATVLNVVVVPKGKEYNQLVFHSFTGAGTI